MDARYASEKQVPRCARNDRQKSKGNGKSRSGFLGWLGLTVGRARQVQKQIPRENDRKKSNYNDNCN